MRSLDFVGLLQILTNGKQTKNGKRPKILTKTKVKFYLFIYIYYTQYEPQVKLINLIYSSLT